MILYAVTDRRGLGVGVLEHAGALLAAGVDWLQIREKDLTARELFELARAVRRLPNPRRTKILINERADVARAAGLDGVHLPSGAPPPRLVRAVLGSEAWIGASAHSPQEVERAHAERADFCVFGPVFETPSKQKYGPPQGLDRFAEACRAVSIPVLALGGVTLGNAAACRDSGAGGVAGISLFRPDSELSSRVERLRAI